MTDAISYQSGHKTLLSISEVTITTNRTVRDDFIVRGATVPFRRDVVGEHIAYDLVGSGLVVHYDGVSVRHDVLVIGERSIDALLVHFTLSGTGTMRGTAYRSDGAIDEWVAAEVPFPVKIVNTARAFAGDQEVDLDYTLTLQATSPRP